MFSWDRSRSRSGSRGRYVFFCGRDVYVFLPYTSFSIGFGSWEVAKTPHKNTDVFRGITNRFQRSGDLLKARFLYSFDSSASIEKQRFNPIHRLQSSINNRTLRTVFDGATCGKPHHVGEVFLEIHHSKFNRKVLEYGKNVVGGGRVWYFLF